LVGSSGGDEDLPTPVAVRVAPKHSRFLESALTHESRLGFRLTQFLVPALAGKRQIAEYFSCDPNYGITLDVFIQKIPKKDRPRSRKQQAKVAAPLASNVARRAFALRRIQ
jgi:hypothetical protein